MTTAGGPVPEQHGLDSWVAGYGFDAWRADTDADFHAHFTRTMDAAAHTFEEFWPAYRFGYDLGFEADDWQAVEPLVRRKWEQGQPGSWEEYREAVRHAWERGRAVRGRG